MMFEIKDEDGDTLQMREALLPQHINICVRDFREEVAASVVITEDQARALRDALTDMLGDGK